METAPQLLVPILAEWPGDMPGPEEFDEEDDSQEELLADDDDDFEDNELIEEEEDDYTSEKEVED